MTRTVEIKGKYNWEFDGFSRNLFHFSNRNSGLASFESIRIEEICQRFPKTKLDFSQPKIIADKILKKGMILTR